MDSICAFNNQTPIDWYTKKQATVETATYGAEFVAARVAKEQIAAHRMDLRYLGVQVKGSTKTFGDNEAVVKSGSIPHSKLTKRHQALSYHSVREGIASGMMSFFHIPGIINPADILSKHWGYQQVWPTLRPVLFWRGNTTDLIDHGEDSGTRKGSITDSILSSPNPDGEYVSNDGTAETRGSDARSGDADVAKGGATMTESNPEDTVAKDTDEGNPTRPTEEPVDRGSWKLTATDEDA